MLATVAQAQLHPAFKGVDTTLLTTLLTAASNQIEGYCNRVFTATDYDETRNGDDTYNIFANQLPITTLSSIVITDDEGTATTYSAGDFAYDANTGKIRYLESRTDGAIRFDDGFQNIVIHYNAGYSTIPEDVQIATVQAAFDLYGHTASRGSFPRGTPSWAEIKQESLSPLVKTLLSKYKVLTI